MQARKTPRRIVRQAAVCVVVLSLFVGAAIAISWHGMPDRYRSTATVRVTEPSDAHYGFDVQLADPVAVAGRTRRAALHTLGPHGPGMTLEVVRRGPDLIELTSTGGAPKATASALRSWTRILARERKRDARHAIVRARQALVRRVRALHDELIRVDSELAKLDPIRYSGLRRLDSPNSGLSTWLTGPTEPPPPAVPEHGTVHELNLAYERLAILDELSVLATQDGEYRIGQVEPQIVTKVVAQHPAHRVDDGLPPATGPAVGTWLAGVALIAGSGWVLLRIKRRPRHRPVP